MSRSLHRTLAVWEDPAARHLVEEWRAAEAPRIASWEDAFGYERVTMASGEVLLLLPARGGRLCAVSASNAAAEALRPTGFVHKLLCFGRVPAGCPAWEGLYLLAAEAAAEPG